MSPQKSHVEALSPSVTVFGADALGEVMGVGPDPVGLVSLYEGAETPEGSLRCQLSTVRGGQAM